MEYIIVWRNSKFLKQECPYTFLTDEDGKLIVDFIGKLENAEKDFLYVLDKLGRTDIEIPHFKTSLRGKYIDYYTPKTRNIVAKRYHKDIQLFEYDFQE